MVTIRWSVHCTNIYGIKSRGIKIDEEACDVYMVGGGGGEETWYLQSTKIVVKKKIYQ